MNGRGKATRRGLERIASQNLQGAVRDVWTTLAARYSGLADLSIPAWLLCGLLVRPGGHLALVVPATWRSRVYADVVRYLMLRTFEVELVIEDSHPGWFADALVGTHLVVARRLSDEIASVPLEDRIEWSGNPWVKVRPEAASPTSLVGKAVGGIRPEAAFTSWCGGADISKPPPGVAARIFSHRREWVALRDRARKRVWLQTLEPSALPLSKPLGFSATRRSNGEDALARIPDQLRDIAPRNLRAESLRSIEDLGIQTGQGLRTGCNRFFYVHLVDEMSEEWSIVATNPVFGSGPLRVPTAALRSVLHRQAELDARRAGSARTRVLDLRGWVLPEDFATVAAALSTYRRTGEPPPRRMPDELADYVRYAANTLLPRTAKPISALSAVRTNARPARDNAPPRFWYMLPAFQPRHLPDAFVPRVVHAAPKVYANSDPTLLIDANFSTFRSPEKRWAPDVLSAFLNSVWCKALMEASGTRLGGGALKLEASHLKRLPVPALSDATFAKLQAAIRYDGPSKQRRIDRIVLRALLPTKASLFEVDLFATALDARRGELQAARRTC